jgi:GT2 family glycosyltransferase
MLEPRPAHQLDRPQIDGIAFPRIVSLDVTIVIPFHRNLGQLGKSLPAARAAMPDAEIVVAADGAVDDCRPLAAASGARVVEVPGPSGPAVARNRAAEVATGGILVFIDADVVAAPDAVAGMCAVLSASPELGAIFGAYDLNPPDPGFMSQFKNLAHSYVHEIGNPDASTFWAGLGAIKAEAFRTVGGFDERFARPSVEDIDLGYRLVAAGYRIRLDPRFRGTHLKRWTFTNCVVTDLRARGIPWTQLLHRTGGMSNDLNTRHELRLSVAVSFLCVLALAAVPFTWWGIPVAIAALGALVWLNREFYGWFARKRGRWFAARVVPVHLVHHLCNGISFVTGTVLHLLGRRGVRLPGTIPATVWPVTRPAPLDTAARAR